MRDKLKNLDMYDVKVKKYENAQKSPDFDEEEY